MRRSYSHSTALILFLMLAITQSAFASDGWEWTIDPTPGSENSIVSESEEDAESTYSDGTLSTDILLSEIMPDPEGSDTDAEWIELYNASTENVDLGNWTLDDEEGGSDPYVFSAGSVIEAQDFLVVYRVDSDLALNNDADEVRLYDFENTLQDSASYENAPEGQSYARISLESPTASRGWLAQWIPTAQAEDLGIAWKEVPWEWTTEITQGALNPIYYWLKGTVKATEPFENKIQLDQGDGIIELSLEKLSLQDELKTMIFQPGNTVSGYGTPAKGQGFELRTLETYEIVTSAESAARFSKLKIMLILLILSGLGAIAWHTKKTNSKGSNRPGLAFS